jgi:hypothetical protein
VRSRILTTTIAAATAFAPAASAEFGNPPPVEAKAYHSAETSRGRENRLVIHLGKNSLDLAFVDVTPAKTKGGTK